MDKYEKEFFQKIKQSAKSMVVNRAELGELRLKRLVAMTYFLIKEKNEKFDLLVGGGNSGVSTLEIIKMVYKKVGVKIPKVVVLPVVRPSNEKNIKIDENLVSEQLKNIGSVSRLLFVDDEIMRGQTAKVCFETVRDFLSQRIVNSCLSCTIVAENHFFSWRYDLRNISVRFLPFSLVLQGYNGNFGYLIPENIISDLEPILGNGSIDRNQALAVLLGNKRKMVKDETALFDHKIGKEVADKVHNYSQKKQMFVERIERLVEEGIEEYKKKEIQFKYLP